MRSRYQCASNVSIHTRHYWRVKHDEMERRQEMAVSIHTRHYWRVKLGRGGGCTTAGTFQSTPAITGG